MSESSVRKVEAARANGALSRGPKTPEGKRRSSMNALKHGLRSRITLSVENPEAFQELLDSYLVRFQPTCSVSRDLVEEMAVARWRIQRIWDIEAALIDDEMDRQSKSIAGEFRRIDEPTRLALAFRGASEKSPALALCGRFENRYRRSFARAFEQLKKMNERTQARPSDEAGATAHTDPPPR